MKCVLLNLFLPNLTAGKVFLFPLIKVSFQPSESQKSVPLKVSNNSTIISSTDEFTAILSADSDCKNQVKIAQNSATIAVKRDAVGKFIKIMPLINSVCIKHSLLLNIFVVHWSRLFT